MRSSGGATRSPSAVGTPPNAAHCSAAPRAGGLAHWGRIRMPVTPQGRLGARRRPAPSPRPEPVRRLPLPACRPTAPRRRAPASPAATALPDRLSRLTPAPPTGRVSLTWHRGEASSAACFPCPVPVKSDIFPRTHGPPGLLRGRWGGTLQGWLGVHRILLLDLPAQSVAVSGGLLCPLSLYVSWVWCPPSRPPRRRQQGCPGGTWLAPPSPRTGRLSGRHLPACCWSRHSRVPDAD